MTYLAAKLEHLRAETAQLRAAVEAIAAKPEPTAADRRDFEEFVELILEIKDYAARLQRPGEKWLVKRGQS